MMSLERVLSNWVSCVIRLRGALRMWPWVNNMISVFHILCVVKKRSVIMCTDSPKKVVHDASINGKFKNRCCHNNCPELMRKGSSCLKALQRSSSRRFEVVLCGQTSGRRGKLTYCLGSLVDVWRYKHWTYNKMEQRWKEIDQLIWAFGDPKDPGVEEWRDCGHIMQWNVHVIWVFYWVILQCYKVSRCNHTQSSDKERGFTHYYAILYICRTC